MMRVRLTNPSPKRVFAQLEALLAGMILTFSSSYAATICPMLWTQAQLEADLRNRVFISSVVDRWYLEKGTWPKSDLTDIAADSAFADSGLPLNPVTGNSYRFDPLTHRVLP